MQVKLEITQENSVTFLRDVDPIVKRLERLSAAVVEARVRLDGDVPAASMGHFIDLLVQSVPDALLEMHEACLNAKARLLFGLDMDGFARSLSEPAATKTTRRRTRRKPRTR